MNGADEQCSVVAPRAPGRRGLGSLQYTDLGMRHVVGMRVGSRQ